MRYHRLPRALLRPTRRLALGGLERWDAAVVRRRAARISSVSDLRVVAFHRARSGMRILRLRDHAGSEAVLKLTDAAGGAVALEREAATLALLGSTPLADELRSRLPEVIDTGSLDNWSYLLLRALPGVPATAPFLDPSRREAVLNAAASFAWRLHAETSNMRRVEVEDRDAWVTHPIEATGSLLGPADNERLQHLSAATIAQLPATASTGWIHGDFWSENVLVDARTLAVTGIVDWDSAVPRGLAIHDQLHFLLYGRKTGRATEIGEEICRMLGGTSRLDAGEAAIVDRVVTDFQPETRDASLRTALTLYWLRLVATNLERQPRITKRRAWVDANVRQVLRCL